LPVETMLRIYGQQLCWNRRNSAMEEKLHG
jgi:hypothetical protein